MLTPQDQKQIDRAFRGQVKRELASYRTITTNCGALYRDLEAAYSRGNLGEDSSASSTLGKSSDDLQKTLDSLKNYLIKTSSSLNHQGKRMETAATSKKSIVTRDAILAVTSELAQYKTRLAEREDQIILLLDNGLSLAFKKEKLEKELAASRLR